MKPRAVLAAALAVLGIACGDPPGASRAGDETEQAPRGVAPEGADPPGIRFDPAAIRPGDSVGALVADSIAARPNVVDSTLVGMARFRGSLELSGRFIPHPDPDLREESVCFEADPESAARLPRWAGDERRSWFCFSNPGEAAVARAEAGASRATLAIDELTIHRGLSDEVNSARLVSG